MGTEWNPQEVSKFPNLSVPGENRAKLRDNSSLVCPVSSKFTESCFIALMQYDWCKSRTIRLTNEASLLIAAVYEIHLEDKKPKEIPRQNHLVKKMQKKSTVRDHDMISSSKCAKSAGSNGSCCRYVWVLSTGKADGGFSREEGIALQRSLRWEEPMTIVWNKSGL